MNRFILKTLLSQTIISASIALLFSTVAFAQNKPPTTRAAQPPADQPAPRYDKAGHIQSIFRDMHESFLKRGKAGAVGLLFLGDSITQRWSSAPDLWKARYDKCQPANFGINGDTTQGVLWRIANGELDGIHPKVVVLMIGTNNANSYSADEVFAGVSEVLKQTRQKLPESRVLLLCIFPRGKRDLPNGKVLDWAKPKEIIKQVNARLPSLADGDRVRVLDLTQNFLVDGVVPADILWDGVHPSEKGYHIWADAMAPTLDEMMALPPLTK